MIELLSLNKLEDRNYYLECLLSVSNQSPYNSIEYFELFCSGIENLICLKGIIDDAIILLPGYKREIPGVDLYTDFVSPYGYSGPIYSAGMNKACLATFWKEVQGWFIANNIVSAFIRFSLNENFEYFPGLLKSTMLNVKGIVLPKEKDQWGNYDRKVRKNVNKALREGLKANIVRGKELSLNQLEIFHNVYLSTMRRINATDNFYYKFETFKQFISLKGEVTAFSFVRDMDIITSVEMILLSDDTAYSFLGGTVSEYFSNRPNDLLKHCLINWLRINGIKYFILGGGYGTNDGIFKYKRSFFPDDVVDYFTGRWIILEEIYNSILENVKYEYQRKYNLSEESEHIDFFPEYRKYIITK